RRLAIHLLAKTARVTIDATPMPSAVDPEGRPLPMTLEESEDVARVAEVMHDLISPGEFKQTIQVLWDEREWDWFAETFPDEAQIFAMEIGGNSIYQSLRLELI